VIHKRYFKDREVPVCLQSYGNYLPYCNRTFSLFMEVTSLDEHPTTIL